MTSQTQAVSPAAAPARAITAAVLGAAFWFAAAMAVRFAGPAGAFKGLWRVLTYAAAVPFLWPGVLLTQRLTAARPGAGIRAIAIALMTALFLDGVALAWFPRLYGRDPTIILAGAAWILWGAGVTLATTFLLLRDQAPL